MAIWIFFLHIVSVFSAPPRTNSELSLSNWLAGSDDLPSVVPPTLINTFNEKYKFCVEVAIERNLRGLSSLLTSDYVTPEIKSNQLIAFIEKLYSFFRTPKSAETQAYRDRIWKTDSVLLRYREKSEHERVLTFLSAYNALLGPKADPKSISTSAKHYTLKSDMRACGLVGIADFLDKHVPGYYRDRDIVTFIDKLYAVVMVIEHDGYNILTRKIVRKVEKINQILLERNVEQQKKFSQAFGELNSNDLMVNPEYVNKLKQAKEDLIEDADLYDLQGLGDFLLYEKLLPLNDYETLYGQFLTKAKSLSAQLNELDSKDVGKVLKRVNLFLLNWDSLDSASKTKAFQLAHNVLTTEQ